MFTIGQHSFTGHHKYSSTRKTIPITIAREILFPLFSDTLKDNRLVPVIPHSHNTAIDLSLLQACPECDLLLEKIIPTDGKRSECPRCGFVLSRNKENSVTRSLSLGIAGLLLYFPALFLPLMTFNKLGLSDSGNVFETIIDFLKNGYLFVAVIALISAALFPLVKLSLLVIITSCLKVRRYPEVLPTLFRLYLHLDLWAMVEVYLLGIMITIIKMYHSTEIVFNGGFFCYIGLVILTIASSVTVAKEQFWELIEQKGSPPLTPRKGKNNQKSIPPDNSSAAASGLILCGDCHKLLFFHNHTGDRSTVCPRCRATLHLRKPASIAKTWALILTALIFFIPANTLPIMRIEFLGIPSNSTIIDGIEIFFQDGSYGIAVIILVASVLIPIFKIVGLGLALASIHLKRPYFLKQKTQIFRMIEFIGRWSMLDIFVIAILAVFVNFGFLTSIETAPAATYFCLVVVTTMFAAMTFDPRLMWDVLIKEELQHEEP